MLCPAALHCSQVCSVKAATEPGCWNLFAAGRNWTFRNSKERIATTWVEAMSRALEQAADAFGRSLWLSMRDAGSGDDAGGAGAAAASAGCSGDGGGGDGGGGSAPDTRDARSSSEVAALPRVSLAYHSRDLHAMSSSTESPVLLDIALEEAAADEEERVAAGVEEEGDADSDGGGESPKRGSERRRGSSNLSKMFTSLNPFSPRDLRDSAAGRRGSGGALVGSSKVKEEAEEAEEELPVDIADPNAGGVASEATAVGLAVAGHLIVPGAMVRDFL